MRRFNTLAAACAALAMLLSMTAPLYAVDANPVNINSATIDELTQLKHIGPEYARRIVEFRETTPFKTKEDLTRVPGIGPRILEINAGRIVVE